MIEIPDLAIVAAGMLSAFCVGSELLRTRRHKARQRAEIASLRTQLESVRQDVGRTSRAYTAEVVHLALERIPAAATRAAHPHVQVPGPLNPTLTDSELGTGLDAALGGVATAMLQERKRVDAAARAAMRGATREIQAGLYRLQDVLRGLQQRYDDPELSQTLYSLDHENEQSLRRAQVAAVVCGAWVGLAREESHLVDAVTGGQSRLIGYQRVQISNHLENGTALVSHAVEPVAIIVAELLDNALRHSSPETTVTVNLERAHHGVTVTVDDAGVGMAGDEREYAQRMVAGSDPILLSELGDPPRMGLAAIGQLTRQFDLSVDLSTPSPYGGVRAVLLVKNHLLSHIDPARRPQAASAPHSTRGSGALDALAPAALPPGDGSPPPQGSPPAPAAPARPPVPDALAHRAGTSLVPPPSGPAGSRTALPPPVGPSIAPGSPLVPPPNTPPAGSRPPLPPPSSPRTAPGPNPGHQPHPGHPAHPAPTTATAVPGPPAPPPRIPPLTPVRSLSDTITHDPAPAPGDEALPRRRRRIRAGAYPAAVPARPQPPQRTPEEAAAALGALQAGTAAARNAAEPEGNDPR